METDAKTTRAPNRTSSILVTCAWLVVGVPLLWGVVETIQKALPLFQTR